MFMKVMTRMTAVEAYSVLRSLGRKRYAHMAVYDTLSFHRSIAQ